MQQKLSKLKQMTQKGLVGVNDFSVVHLMISKLGRMDDNTLISNRRKFLEAKGILDFKLKSWVYRRFG